MGNGFQFLDIILFAAVAAFFVLRLRGVLGKRTGHQKPNLELFTKRKKAEAEEDKVIPLPDRNRAANAEEAEGEEAPEIAARTAGPETPLAAGLLQIKRADKAFDEEQFLTGARTAFEWVINAFAPDLAASDPPDYGNDWTTSGVKGPVQGLMFTYSITDN